MNLLDGWAKRAACLGTDPEVFHPTVSRDGQNCYEPARAICAGCSVTEECLAFALTTQARGFEYGMWGGMTPEERRDLRRWMDRQVSA